MDELKKLKKQHIDNYKNSVVDIINNNTNILVDEDISSLIKTPPLDSMDFLKKKILSYAKKNRIILNTDSLNKLLESYRLNILKCCSTIKKIRKDGLMIKVNKASFEKDYDIIKVNKKDFVVINRAIKKSLKEQLYLSFQNCLLNKINSIFPKDIDSDIKKSIVDDLTKYVKSTYQKQLIENVDIKILVKDTILMNNVKEQSERYLFTLKNSRLLNDSLQ